MGQYRRCWQCLGRVVLVAALAGPLVLPWQAAQAAGAAEVASLSHDLADMLVILSGTAAVFDSSRVQAALRDPQPLLGSDGQRLDVLKVKNLLKSAGFRAWTQRPTVWVVESGSNGTSLTVLSADPHMQAEAKTRGLPLSPVAFTDADISVVAALAQGAEQPTLPGLLAAHKADALVVVTRSGTSVRWQFLQPGHHFEGQMTADVDVRALLPHVLCEALAGQFQWPESYGRPVVRVRGIQTLTDFAAAQAALSKLNGVHGVSVIRLDGSTAYFAVDPMSPAALAVALGGEARLAADTKTPEGINPAVAQGRLLGSPVQARVWTAQAAPGNPPAQVQ